VSFTPRPIVDTHDVRRWRGGRGTTSPPPQHGVATARHALAPSCRAPAAPPRASPVVAGRWRNRGVVWAERGATVGRRSVKVWRPQVQVVQKNRRTGKRSGIGIVAQGKSARGRGESLCMRAASCCQSGQAAWGAVIVATRVMPCSPRRRGLHCKGSSGGSSWAQRSCQVISGGRPYTRGANDTGERGNTSIVSRLDSWCESARLIPARLTPDGQVAAREATPHVAGMRTCIWGDLII